jgi:hypothetical protein
VKVTSGAGPDCRGSESPAEEMIVATSRTDHPPDRWIKTEDE